MYYGTTLCYMIRSTFCWRYDLCYQQNKYV